MLEYGITLVGLHRRYKYFVIPSHVEIGFLISFGSFDPRTGGKFTVGIQDGMPGMYSMSSKPGNIDVSGNLMALNSDVLEIKLYLDGNHVQGIGSYRLPYYSGRVQFFGELWDNLEQG